MLDSGTVIVRDLPPGKNALLGNSGYVFRALSRGTGMKLWEAATSWKYSRWIEKDGVLYVSDRKDHALMDEGGQTSPDSWITAVDLKTGKEIWRSEMVELATFTMPAAGEGMVAVGSEPFGSGKPAVSGLWVYSIPR
jgi:outer membrane protein assembly factor BamB